MFRQYLFTLPLFFQVVLLDSASVAGARLAIPSLVYPVGSIIAGLVISRYGKLIPLVRVGALLMAFGNALVTSLCFHDALYKYYVFIVPANLGQGIIYPAILFTNLATFEHSGESGCHCSGGMHANIRPDHAVSASTVYLVRSVGSVWGVAISSAIVQTTLKARLPAALGDLPDKPELIEHIRHSVTTLKDLAPAIQLPARMAYYEGIRYAFAASTGFAVFGLLASLIANGKGLRSTSK
ncbi:hypothetical protein LTR56_021449 [Elasticomyces elasticus]|nr:hypothetical protein LTR56_021449 [Elasticomyces elasticus]KAK3632859.1 hypothetical protein LTR22_020410 [Elasticomyces elasticus]KAK4912174.1 hypothetical protein LTR49_019362 [Elasticomyces elasticus]KAK5747676.1 hypothetical protein LTS12_022276 [Elasticomyces elasticus]